MYVTRLHWLLAAMWLASVIKFGGCMCTVGTCYDTLYGVMKKKNAVWNGGLHVIIRLCRCRRRLERAPQDLIVT